jgi:hypothetical protein
MGSILPCVEEAADGLDALGARGLPDDADVVRSTSRSAKPLT